MMTGSDVMSDAGCQEPTFSWVIPYSQSKGDAVIEFGRRELRLNLDAWQRSIMDAWVAVYESVHPDSGLSYLKYVHVRNGLEVARQNGKTALLELRIIWGAVVKGEKILYTAHDYSTIQQLFDRMKMYFGDKPSDEDCRFKKLNKIVKVVRKATGKEAIFLKNGGAIYFSTRTKSAKRGFTVDVVIVDEAQELTDVQLKAIMATASAGPLRNPQYIFVGTPPGPESSGDVFQGMREKVRSGEDCGDMSWFEWSVDEVGDITDQARWYRVNPGLGVRIGIDAVLAELGSFKDPVSFAQERLGYWLPRERIETVIGYDEWNECLTKDPPDGGGDCRRPPKGTAVCFGVKIAPDDSCGSLAVCIRPRGGVPHVELIESFLMDDGIGWLADWLVKHGKTCTAVAIDGKGSAAALAKKIDVLGFPKMKNLRPGYSDAAAAYSMMRNAVRDKEITHLDDEILADSATKSARRKIGNDGGYGFASTQSADSTPIEACSLALWATTASKINPNIETGLAYL